MSTGKCAFIGILMLLSFSLVMAQDPPAVHPLTGEELLIDCLRGTPVAIDGDLSDWNLDAMPVARLDVEEQLYTGNANWDGPEDCSGQFYVLWDDQNVYIAAIVKDDKLSMNKTGGNIWNADCIEVFFSTTNAVAGHAEHYQWGFNAQEQTWLWDDMEGAGQSAVDYLEVAAVQTADGYICEASMPYSEITPLDWSVGSAIGFHPVIDDTDDGDREIQMTWTGREAHDQSLGYGHIILSDKAARLPELAGEANPAPDAVDVPMGTTLSWSPGDYAVTHDVYFGATFEDVNEATTPDSAGQSDTDYDPGRLEFGQTYYWRVDEVNGAPDHTVYRGEVWNFTIEPKAIPVEGITATASSVQSPGMGPEKTIDGSGLNELDQHSTLATDMWLSAAGPAPWIQYEFDKTYKLDQLIVWNSNQLVESFLGLGAKGVTVEYSEDGAAWTALEGPIVFNQATSRDDYEANTAVDFGGVQARFVRITINTGYGMIPQYGLSEVRFLYIPTFAREPEPVDGAMMDSADVMLSWRSGREAASSELYLGTEAADLELVATTSEPAYAANGLNYSTTYFWSVTEVNNAEAVPAYAGPVWSFSTPDFGVVDDFEQYDNNCNRIFFAWQDGLGHNGGTEIEGCDVPPSNGNGGGSIVGNDTAPFAEKSIVNAGSSQSMPFNYDNTFGDSYATLTIDGQDWTASGVQTLALAFRGTVGNTGTLYVKINNAKVTYDQDPADIARAAWQAWNIDLTAVAGLQNVTSLTIGVDGASAKGMLYIDDIRLYPLAGELITPVDPGSDGLVAKYTFSGNYNDSSGNGHNGTPIGNFGIAIENDPIRGQVLSLPGGDDQFVEIGAVGISGTMPRTIACWAKADNTNIPDWTLIFGFTGQADGTGGNGSHFNIGSLGGPGGVGAHVWGWEETMVSDEDALDWHHYAMTYDGTTVQYYADGMLMDSDPAKSNVQDLSASGDRVHIGSRVTQTSSFPGDVDDAVIYDRVLSAEEILFLAGRTMPIHKAL